jgi:tetratricopeptide (TPR) repeat protein
VGNNASLILATLVLVLGMGHARRRALWRKRKRRLFVWAGGCAAIICWLVTNTPLNPHRPGIFSEAFSSKMWVIGGVTRSVIWLDTLEMIRQHQVTGVGPGCFTYVFPSMRSQFVPDDPEWLRFQGAYTNAAHNGLLQVWAELGPVGAFLLVAMVVAAFRALGRAGRAGGTRPAGWAAWGAISALAALCGTSVMTFPLQLPVPTLLFFVLLPMGEILSRAAHRPNRFTMPALAIQGRYGETVVYMEEMNRVTGVAGSFDLPRAVAVIAFVVWLAVCGQWMFSSWKPLVADIVYNRAHTARLMGDRQSADVLYQRALAIWPRHHDCRSEYSEFLLETGRYKECIDHLAIVFKRLDARELYWRRATAYDALGQKAQARRDFAIFRSRMPSISAKSNSDGISVP